MKLKAKVAGTIRMAVVPLLFGTLCVIGIMYSGQPVVYILNTIIERLGRNCFLVLALIIPITAGIGLNFSIVLGAMAAQIAFIFVTDWKIGGLGGIALVAVLSTPLAVFFGYLVGRLFNRARGREMVTGMITGYFANGIYQLIFLFGAGTVFAIHSADMLLTRGQNADGTPRLMGLRNMVDLTRIQYALDGLIPGTFIQGLMIPVFPFILIALACVFIVYFRKTKLGQEMKAMGHDLHIAEISGIPVNRNRIIAMIISTVMAAWGQVIFLQNIGTVNTYNSHEQVGMFSIAALLVAGASISKASIWNALLGTLLFHVLFYTSPLAAKTILGNAQLGEFFRVFIAYGVIAVALALHAWQKKKR